MAGFHELAFGHAGREGFIDQHHGQPVAAVQAAGKALAAPPMLVVLCFAGAADDEEHRPPLFDERSDGGEESGLVARGKRGERHRQAQFEIPLGETGAGKAIIEGEHRSAPRQGGFNRVRHG